MQASILFGEGLRAPDTCSIHELRISSCDLSQHGVVAELAAALGEHPGQMEILCLWDCSLDDSILAMLVSALVRNSTLKKLYLREDGVGVLNLTLHWGSVIKQ